VSKLLGRLPLFYHNAKQKMTAMKCFPFLILLALMAPLSVVAYLPDRKLCQPRPHNSPLPSNDATVPQSPDKFEVRWITTAGDLPIVLEVVREWSPRGVDRFYQLVMDNYFDCAAFFRVAPGK
jgi:hypothetical protein